MAAKTDINPIAVGAMAAGLIFVWSGVKGASVLQTIQSLIKGEKPAGANIYPVVTPGGGTGAQDGGGTVLAKGGTPAKNQAIAKTLAASYGWDSGAEWDALVWLWNAESSWSNTAENPGSGAYGIPQALPPTKLPKAGRPPKLGGTSDAGAQISWGLSYIKSRYGSPSKAKSFHLSHHWY